MFFPQGNHFEFGLPFEVHNFYFFIYLFIVCAPFELNKCPLHPPQNVDVQESDLMEELPPPELLKDLFDGKEVQWPPLPDPGEPPNVQLRFAVGTRVECRVGKDTAPNGGWSVGSVVQHWWRMPMWPTGQFAPYQVQYCILLRIINLFGEFLLI